VSALIAKLHNAWEWLNPGVRVALAFGAATFLGLVQTFGWTVPQTLDQAQVEIALFVAFAAPVMVVVVQARIMPAVVAWLLSTFSLDREMTLQAISPGSRVRNAVYTGRWVKAA
jgi:hypothetical protein